MSGVEGIDHVRARARRLLRHAQVPHVARAVEAEYVRQMSAQAGQIPVDTGDLLRAMTSSASSDRVVTQDARGVNIKIRLAQAYWQRHRLPKIDGTQMARAVAGALTGDGR